VVLEKPGLGIKGVTTSTRVIAVNMPNQLGIQTKSYKDYLTTVRDLEKLTGYNFLSDVPKKIQDAIEAEKDRG
jgi:endonuclease G